MHRNTIIAALCALVIFSSLFASLVVKVSITLDAVEVEAVKAYLVDRSTDSPYEGKTGEELLEIELSRSFDTLWREASEAATKRSTPKLTKEQTRDKLLEKR